ncbi:hypothetical protein BEP19_11500 [Ammoniphilus oxalaticus]|uniref:LysM domain-containing protein n=1 Tax=Ammoniphilus oxalaticus TaxID=66863 RepID=A0A419SHG0_9BACL|nr:hypothetical protein BEP19_11500 [Ammoniphilus oxalaticus]
MNHVVQPGENLWSIAARYGVSVQQIMRVNGITDPNRIYVGTVIQIPVGSSYSPSGPTQPSPTPPPTPGPGRNLERRVNSLEREVNQLGRRVERLEDRVRRIEGR